LTAELTYYHHHYPTISFQERVISLYGRVSGVPSGESRVPGGESRVRGVESSVPGGESYTDVDSESSVDEDLDRLRQEMADEVFAHDLQVYIKDQSIIIINLCIL